MASIDLYGQSGEKKGEIKVDDRMFNVENCDHALIHEALIRQDSNARKNIAHTKTKAEVRGGGRKSRPQKGTGGARQGSIRNPHMKGGGVCFGPRNNRNFYKMMPKKQRRKALFSALTLKCRDKEILALESYDFPELKTKIFAAMIERMGLQGKILLVADVKNKILELSARNLENVKVILVHNLNIKDVLTYNKVLFLKNSLSVMEEMYK
ncbi:MAG: 50S ribosomal protein L4, large subunit ribosomal protein L4 [Candidatus Peregrinibacteria bacterium GW2011_GWF2_33_10]|nr:MAG: 50S ribosomal protein L4, large subunit ribosomal protein L4 [Candidatus Peregrinibacteria bacterium GW2011_GWF2_33_10]OGJ46136.1 MAG: 50S ribosomal protein L4 [Candidatus Peregrinibacteria bacterium RIFOXYA12_FULL_33_12]OGJ46158.1 MAG: 50S ribosomal protein L4 [Candidatus Peregrinibacteria bacterium RIFOXYA2_FULL_33_21]OGJ51575.1 MAG: 50S ribosomal protein L4 [Candidatus Peregrinibacteria bacterium RIFOXYB2_FULL_33_20]